MKWFMIERHGGNKERRRLYIHNGRRWKGEREEKNGAPRGQVKGARRDDEDENDNEVVVEYNTSGVYVHNMRRTDSVERDVG
jgi:hypothetical protein